jgi:hypothetical protein
MWGFLRSAPAMSGAKGCGFAMEQVCSFATIPVKDHAACASTELARSANLPVNGGPTFG